MACFQARPQGPGIKWREQEKENTEALNLCMSVEQAPVQGGNAGQKGNERKVHAVI